jgi:hypothetical protein
MTPKWITTHMAVFVNFCARVFTELITCAKTCAKLVRTRRAQRFPNTCESVVPRLRANLRQTCTKLALDLRRRARGALRSSLTAPRNFRKTRESRGEGIYQRRHMFCVDALLSGARINVFRGCLAIECIYKQSSLRGTRVHGTPGQNDNWALLPGAEAHK